MGCRSRDPAGVFEGRRLCGIEAEALSAAKTRQSSTAIPTHTVISGLRAPFRAITVESAGESSPLRHWFNLREE
jgi:hypothetical protein